MNVNLKDGVIVRDSIAWDINHIAQDMRQSDAAEVWVSHRHNPLKAATMAFYQSTICLTVECNNKVVMMFGICPHTFLGQKANIWMLATKDFDKIHRKLIRHSRGFIKYFLQHYPELENYVSCDNKLSVKWLTWCGAIKEEPKPFGVDGKLFQRFYFRRKSYALAS